MRSHIARRLVIAAAIATLAVPAGIAVATPPSGITKAEVIGQGTFSERVKVKMPNIKAKIKPSEFVVQDIEIAPGGHTGWHTHPGPALVIIKEGNFTLYDGDDRKCRPHRYEAGQAFVDEGGGHVHIGRNETSQAAKLLVTYILPEGITTPRIDAEAPGNCPF